MAEKLEPLSEEEIAEWLRLVRDAKAMSVHCGACDTANEALAVFTSNSLPRLLAEHKAEVERLEHVVRVAGRMLSECVEYKRQGRCKDAITNVLLRKAREAAEAAGGGDDAAKPGQEGE